MTKLVDAYDQLRAELEQAKAERAALKADADALAETVYSASANLEHLADHSGYMAAAANGPRLIEAVVQELDLALLAYCKKWEE